MEATGFCALSLNPSSSATSHLLQTPPPPTPCFPRTSFPSITILIAGRSISTCMSKHLLQIRNFSGRCTQPWFSILPARQHYYSHFHWLVHTSYPILHRQTIAVPPHPQYHHGLICVALSSPSSPCLVFPCLVSRYPMYFLTL